eukprot:8913891-Lingulodinium_polyedra.AAC.1
MDSGEPTLPIELNAGKTDRLVEKLRRCRERARDVAATPPKGSGRANGVVPAVDRQCEPFGRDP